MKKIGRYMLIALGVILVAIQFIRPERNLSASHSAHLRTSFPVPDSVEALLQVACYDCHSNETRYPWYSNIQPVAWWLADHVEEGKQHLNFSEFTSRKLAVQHHKFEEIVEQVKEGEMPLQSYTITHGDARLSPQQQALLTSWAQAQMDAMKAQYPADSLILRRR
ncbi:MAG: heme-binding domain-containing protein [Bacteroidia bacterium]|nr:heme-binding domain-containing protein [Bacteroidia bacterium]